jgi:hypothetical protein
MTTTSRHAARTIFPMGCLAAILALAVSTWAAAATEAPPAPPAPAIVSSAPPGPTSQQSKGKPGADPVTAPAPAPQRETPDTARPGPTVALPAIGRIGIALAVLALMAGLFSLIFKWQHRIEQSDFFSGIYTAAAESVEAIRLAGPVNDKWKRGEYLEEIFLGRSQRGRDWGDSVKPRPVYDMALEPKARHLDLGWRIDAVARSLSMVPVEREGATANPFRSASTGLSGLGGSNRPEATPGAAQAASGRPEADDRSACEQELEAFSKKAAVWVRQAAAQAWDWYQDDLHAKEQEARTNAKKVLNVDFSAIRGRGPEFALEFTAVVIIIFSAVILGVLGVLDSNQIGTLLAAIAGYVLGKGTVRSQPDAAVQQPPKAAPPPPQPPPPPPPPPQPKLQAEPAPQPQPGH